MWHISLEMSLVLYSPEEWWNRGGVLLTEVWLKLLFLKMGKMVKWTSCSLQLKTFLKKQPIGCLADCLCWQEVLRYRSLFQIDLRDDPKTIAKLNDMKEKPITTEQGQKLAKEVRTTVGPGGMLQKDFFIV